MLRKEGIFGYGTNLKDRIIPDFESLKKLMETLRYMNYRVVLTQGKFNQKHYGHERYLEKARQQGDFLIVGVDSDEKIKEKKGPDYPLIPQGERLEGLAHTRHVDALFLKEKDHPHWALIKAVRPDVLVCSESTKKGGTEPCPPYSPAEMESLKQYCGSIVVLPPQAEHSVTARWRIFQLTVAEKIGNEVLSELSTIVPAAVARAIAKYREGQ